MNLYHTNNYLFDNLDLAKEYSAANPSNTNAYVRKYELDLNNLNILDFTEHSVLSWLAELMKHREADDSKRYKVLSKEFINKYGIDTSNYDVIKGWRANASYFYIAKEFVRDNVDLDILEDLLTLGDLGIQYCLKSQKAFDNLKELEKDLIAVDFKEFNEKYNKRDINARKNMREILLTPIKMKSRMYLVDCWKGNLWKHTQKNIYQML